MMLFKTSLFLLPCLIASVPGAFVTGYGKTSVRKAPCFENVLTGTPYLQHLFTGTFQIANPLKPIPIEGGVRVVEPITGGEISGTALNATVTGGVAYPSIFDNGTLQDAFITIYGTTSDEEAFLVQVTGIGKPSEQFSSIQIEIGADSAKLTKNFILASIAPSADRKTVTVEGYKVSK